MAQSAAHGSYEPTVRGSTPRMSNIFHGFVPFCCNQLTNKQPDHLFQSEPLFKISAGLKAALLQLQASQQVTMPGKVEDDASCIMQRGQPLNS